MGAESEWAAEIVADEQSKADATIAALQARIERLAERRDRWVAAATEARIERDDARRVLLALADGCGTNAIADAACTSGLPEDGDARAWAIVHALIGAVGAKQWPPDWGAIADAIRRKCGVSDG